MPRTAFFAERHFLLTLTVKEASLYLPALCWGGGVSLVLRLSRGERPSAVMIEVRLARVEGCRILQFTLWGIYRLKILSTKSEIRNNLEFSKLKFSKHGQQSCPSYKDPSLTVGALFVKRCNTNRPYYGHRGTIGNRQTKSDCLTARSNVSKTSAIKN